MDALHAGHALNVVDAQHVGHGLTVVAEVGVAHIGREATERGHRGPLKELDKPNRHLVRAPGPDRVIVEQRVHKGRPILAHQGHAGRHGDDAPVGLALLQHLEKQVVGQRAEGRHGRRGASLG